MGIKTGSISATSLIDNYIGTAYDNILFVRNNIDDVNLVAENMDVLKYGTVSFVQEEVPTGDGLTQGARWYKPSEPTMYIYYINEGETTGSWVEDNSVGDDVSLDTIEVDGGVSLRDYLDSLDSLNGTLDTRVGTLDTDVTNLTGRVSVNETKLTSIESGAQVNTVKTVSGKTGNVTLDGSDINVTDGTLQNKLNSIDSAVDEVKESLTLKVFQSPADNLTKVTTYAGSVGTVYEVRKTSDDSLATIYSDAAGPTEVAQNGIDNVSGSDGFVEFYIADGDYYIEVGGGRSNFTSVVSSLSVLFEDSNGDDAFLQDLLDGLATAKKIKSKRLEITAEDDFGTPDAAVTVARRHSRPNSGHGFKEFTEFDPTASDVAYAAYDSDFSTVGGNDFDIDHMVSYQSRLQHFSGGDLKYYSSVWALDRIESGSTCSNMFQFYDQGRTEGSTINHFSFVGNPLVNGTVQNYAGLRVNQPVGNVGGEIQNTLTGVYIEDISFAGGASTYPIFIETQTNEASIGCYWRFKNRLIMEGATIFKVSPTPDLDATRDLGGSNFRWKQFYTITNNSTLLNLEPQGTEPTKIAGKTIAMSDGTASTNSFGTSGEGLYRCNSTGTWVFVG